MDFGTFMEKYGYNLILILIFTGVIGLFTIKFMEGLMVLGLSKIESIEFVGLIFVVVGLVVILTHKFKVKTVSDKLYRP